MGASGQTGYAYSVKDHSGNLLGGLGADGSVHGSSLSTGTSATGTTCTVGGYITVVVDGTTRKLAYCN